MSPELASGGICSPGTAGHYPAPQPLVGGVGVASWVLMTNLNLLFWLSLLPFTTGWMGENHFAEAPVALYGINLLLSAIAFYILQSVVTSAHHDHSLFRDALGSDLKGKGSLVAYGLGTTLALFGWPKLGFAVLVAVAIMWFVPDRRMEQVIAKRSG